MRRKAGIFIGLCMGLCVLPALAGTPLYEPDLSINYQAFGTLEQRAGTGDAEAQFELYNLYGLKGDYVAAYQWLEKAADSGHRDALFWSFMRYDNGGNFSDHSQITDYAKAFRRLKQLEVVDPEAAWYSLGIYYRYGKGVKRNDTQALRYFTLSSHAANFRAQMALGELYAEGVSVKRDNLEAYVWYALGAEQLLHFRSEVIFGFVDCNGPCPKEASSETIVSRRKGLESRLTPAEFKMAKARMKVFRDTHPLISCGADCEAAVQTVGPPPQVSKATTLQPA